MKWILLCWVALATMAAALPDTLSDLRRQVNEQERQIRQLETENARLRYMLTEMDHHVGDPVAGAKVSGRPGNGVGSKPDPGEFHVVARGETLSKIATKRQVDLDTLVALNRLDDPSSIHPGQRLRLPERSVATAQTPPSTSGSSSHTIQAGENLYRISLRYGVDLDELMAANPSIDPFKLRVGQQVRIPQEKGMLAGGG